MAEEQTKEKAADKGGDLLKKACRAYGIDERHVFSSRYDEAAQCVVVVTAGGTRVRFSEKDQVERKLSDIQVTGINPDLERRKPVAGKKR